MYNIFHPFDPCAYRIEPMVNAEYQEKPVLIPHHTGRKRFHLELRENLAKMGVELKNSIVSSMKSAMTGINSLIYGAQDRQTMIKQHGENESRRNESNDGAGDNATENNNSICGFSEILFLFIIFMCFNFLYERGGPRSNRRIHGNSKRHFSDRKRR